MGFLDCADSAEAFSQLWDALFVGIYCHAVVHIRPLVVLTLGGSQQIFSRLAQMPQLLEPDAGMLLHASSGFKETLGKPVIALALRNVGRWEILLQILFI